MVQVAARAARAAALKADGPAVVRRLEKRLAMTAPQADDTELLIEVAELLFLAFPDRAAELVAMVGDLLGRPPAPSA